MIEPDASFSLAVSPNGRPYLVPLAEGEEGLDREVAERVRAAFAISPASGVLHLGGVELESPLTPSFAYFREIGRTFMTRLASTPELEDVRAAIDVPHSNELASIADYPPPMPGAEYITLEVLEGLWAELLQLVRSELSTHKGSVESYLHSKNPAWNVV